MTKKSNSLGWKTQHFSDVPPIYFINIMAPNFVIKGTTLNV
jgi:hypothetical protein